MRRAAEIVAANVNALVRERGLVWAEVAKRSGIGRTTLTRVQNGGNFSIAVLDKLARYLRVPAAELLSADALSADPDSAQARPGVASPSGVSAYGQRLDDTVIEEILDLIEDNRQSYDDAPPTNKLVAGVLADNYDAVRRERTEVYHRRIARIIGESLSNEQQRGRPRATRDRASEKSRE